MSALVKSRLGVALASLPDLLPLALAGFSLPTVILLLLGQFHAALVLPVGLLSALLVLRLIGQERPTVPRREVTWAVLALGVAVASLLANAYLSSQVIVVTRDPSMYAATAQWLAGHSSLPIPTAGAIFAGTPGLVDASLGFQAHAGGGAVDPQGSHLTQALIALVGALFGQSALLKANALLGAVAVLAFFGLARRFAGGGAALLVTVALAVSLPMLHFTRAIFTEPLTLAMVVGGLSMLWRAQQSRRPRDAAAAGLILGTSALARIDGSVSLLFLLILIAFSLALAPRADRLGELARSAALLLGAAVPTVVGLLDLKYLAPGYANDLSAQLQLIATAGLGLLAVSLLVVLIGWRTDRLDRLLSRPRLPALAAAAVLAYCLLLVSRPLWLERHANLTGFYESLSTLQAALRERVDPSRSYDENTVTWLSWYYGWPVLVLAAVGFAVLTFRCVRHRDLTLLPALALVGSVGTLYFWKASIFPDQIWAIRRFLPVVVPLVLVAAAYLLSLIWARPVFGRLLAGALAVPVVLIPWQTSQPLAGVREGVPQLAQIRSVCQALPRDAAVLMADAPAQERYSVTLRSYCGVPTVGLDQPTPQRLAQARSTAATHGRTTWVFATRPDTLPLAPSSPPRGTVTGIGKWQELLEGPPDEEHRYSTTLFLGQVGPDGRVVLSVLPAVGPPS